MTYTDIVDGYQISDVTYIGLPPKDTPPTFDVVRWYDCEPHRAIDMRTGEVKTVTRCCYSVAFLEWDRHEEWWRFRSVGTRWLEESDQKRVTDAVVQMILKFCEEKAKEIVNDETY